MGGWVVGVVGGVGRGWRGGKGDCLRDIKILSCVSPTLVSHLIQHINSTSVLYTNYHLQMVEFGCMQTFSELSINFL